MVRPTPRGAAPRFSCNKKGRNGPARHVAVTAASTASRSHEKRCATKQWRRSKSAKSATSRPAAGARKVWRYDISTRLKFAHG